MVDRISFMRKAIGGHDHKHLHILLKLNCIVDCIYSHSVPPKCSICLIACYRFGMVDKWEGIS